MKDEILITRVTNGFTVSKISLDARMASDVTYVAKTIEKLLDVVKMWGQEKEGTVRTELSAEDMSHGETICLDLTPEKSKKEK